MLFEKLVEQHRVHRFVAHRVGLALFVASHQGWIDLFHVLSHKTELREAFGIKIVLVPEGHRLQGEDGLACFIHRLDCFLKAGRGCGRAKMTVGVYDNCYTCWNGCPTNASDKCLRLILYPADANGARLAPQTSIADVDVFIASGKIAASSKSQRDVLVTNFVV